MTNYELAVSYDTVRHLDQWLMTNFPRNHRDELAPYRTAMLRLIANDEEYWTQRGWWRVHDVALLGCA
jgi:hypothetical protein